MAQPSRAGLYRETLDAVAVLIGDVEPVPRRIDFKVAGRMALGRHYARKGDALRRLVEIEHCNAVRPAIGDVDVPAARMDEHLRSGVPVRIDPVGHGA